MGACAVFLLAQSRSPVAGYSNELLWWTSVLAVGMVALILAGFLVYRTIMRRLSEPEPGPSFDLLELRRLRANGTLTQEQFEKAKNRVIAELSGGATAGGPGEAAGADEPDDEQTGGEEGPNGTPPQ